MLARSFRFKSALILLCLAVAIFLARDLWLSALGAALVHDDGAAKAEIAVVLAGDFTGSRLFKSAELVKQGCVPAVLVSGPPGFYGVNEADAAIRFAVARGYPSQWFIPVRHSALSTRDEAMVLVDSLKQRHIHSFLLVTSTFHSARARRLFLQAIGRRGGGLELRVVTAGDRYFTTANWWHNREGLKTTFLEWIKTVTSVFGI